MDWAVPNSKLQGIMGWSCPRVHGGITSSVRPSRCRRCRRPRSDCGKPRRSKRDEVLISHDHTQVSAAGCGYGSAPAVFAGAELGVSGPVDKSVGDLEDNQISTRIVTALSPPLKNPIDRSRGLVTQPCLDRL
jgi:hypothetical protein